MAAHEAPIPGILQARTLEWVAVSFSNAWKWKVKVKLLSRAQLLATPWTAAYQAPPSMGFSRQEYWSGSPVPSLAKGTITVKDRSSSTMKFWSRTGYGGRNSSGEICSMGGALAISSVQSLSRVQIFASPWTAGLLSSRPPCPSPTPRPTETSCPWCQWYHPIISSSVIPFSSLLHSFPASGSFPMSWFFASGGQSIGVSAFSISPSNEYSGLISFGI